MIKTISISILVILCLLFLIDNINGTLSRGDKKSKNANKKAQSQSYKKVKHPSSGSSVVEPSSFIAEILDNHSSPISSEHIGNDGSDGSAFPNTVLGYVTPWNSGGYRIAEKYEQKFSYVCPVWLQLRIAGEQLKLEGVQDVNIEFMKNMPSDKIVPRLIFEQIPPNFFKFPNIMKNFIDMFTKYLSSYGGVVLEIFSQVDPSYHSSVIEFIIEFAEELHHQNKILIIPISPPIDHTGASSPAQKYIVDTLLPHVDYFSLMTYDYNKVNRPGPNAPIEWIEQCVEMLMPRYKTTASDRSKLLIGMNFYGYSYMQGKVDAITSPSVLQFIKKKGVKAKWHSEYKEHSFFSKKGEIYYPTTRFITERLKLANKLGVGVALWELGQGHERFCSLL